MGDDGGIGCLAASSMGTAVSASHWAIFQEVQADVVILTEGRSDPCRSSRTMRESVGYNVQEV